MVIAMRSSWEKSFPQNQRRGGTKNDDVEGSDGMV
jgi:hypothetical protein